MSQPKYSSAKDDANSNNAGRGGFSSFPAFNLSSMLHSSANRMIPNSQVPAGAYYNRANGGPRIARPSDATTLLTPSKGKGGNVPILPRPFPLGESSGSGASPKKDVLRGVQIEPNLGRFICLPPNQSVAWKDQAGKLIAIVTKHPDPRATYNVKPLHSFEVELFPNGSGFASNLGRKPSVQIKEPHADANNANGHAAENVPEIGSCRKRKRDSTSVQRDLPQAKARDAKVLKSVIRIESEDDIPSDGYSWRKYGQKRLKGNPHGPRCYYRCNFVGCTIRKHVERAVDDPRYVVATYDGKHTHLVPNPRRKNKIIFDEVPMPPPFAACPSPIAIQQGTPAEEETALPNAAPAELPHVAPAAGSISSESSGIGPVPPPLPPPRPFLFDLNLPPPPEEDDDVVVKAEPVV
ncbi:hypothetical protein RIF29_21777 [Crotalaria pallida]|uniref:WRKY domain-containing protein n=1 Tax=Crotalaria pallida TaxID=3830 RepID=A0AAN9I7H4_CROPI